MSHDTSPVAGMATGSLPQLCMKMSAIPICGPERRLSGSSNKTASLVPRIRNTSFEMTCNENERFQYKHLNCNAI
mgnify:CR=1 FL=1|jgi:hypothetical protein